MIIHVTRFRSISAKERLLDPLRAGISVTLFPPLLRVAPRFESSNIIGRDARGLSEVTLHLYEASGKKGNFDQTPRLRSNYISEESDVRDAADESRLYKCLQIEAKAPTGTQKPAGGRCRYV